jgi:hypothetical protein
MLSIELFWVAWNCGVGVGKHHMLRAPFCRATMSSLPRHLSWHLRNVSARDLAQWHMMAFGPWGRERITCHCGAKDAMEVRKSQGLRLSCT